ncbi:hypothetical protein K491DRAFT_598985 [Lophiostoma macrostomum CBS 122681]|uniref:Zinc finger C2H2 LYAR-type domain-containing protein n=1 Tax=Lophiostoma macrostomum CBS 122681 TaxID=1314788 RepID=A0A6A6T670_9PLEO|nr:hypothetical protein K491DRAFT_598985 [Lophiostoma macrostomum CBS 122681]
MVSFSCENCGDVLTKKKLDGHRNQCYGASYTCLDCMVHFQGTAYKSHTSCITEDQKYQGKLYKDKKAKSQHQKRDSAQQTSQALVPRSAYVEDAPDADTGAIAIVDAPPRAPSPPPAAFSLGYNEQAQLEDVNVFDFLDGSETPTTSRVNHQHVDESRMIEDSIPPAYEEMPSAVPDVMNFQVPDDEPYSQNGFSYGNEPVRPTSERYESSYNFREQDPNFNFTTPAPKSKHSRTKSKDKDVDASTTKTERKRKRSSPTELDMSLVRAQHERDIMMADAPPMLHSGLTGGLNRLLARPGEFPPSPDYSGDYVENSPLSPMKRAKQGTTKAFARAQREYEIQQEKDRKAGLEKETAREKEKKEKDRGRERERKERKASTALVKVRPKKRRDDSARADRRHRGVEVRRRRDYSSSPSPPPRERKPVKAIEYHTTGSRSSPEENGNGALIVRESGQLAPIKTGDEARADLFMSFINKGPDSERGMSVNKALKRYHRERYERWDRELGKADEEKELWKSLRLKKNDRGEIVLFFSPADA